jgi:hypothetical protein
MNKYERIIPPIRKEESLVLAPPEARPRNGGKIIPFPGVSLEAGSTFNDSLYDFLRETGYIE